MTVHKGDTIALSGNTGHTLNQSHLHFDVVKPAAGQIPDISSQSRFVNFKNSKEYPKALQQGKWVKALAYTIN